MNFTTVTRCQFDNSNMIQYEQKNRLYLEHLENPKAVALALTNYEEMPFIETVESATGINLEDRIKGIIVPENFVLLDEKRMRNPLLRIGNYEIRFFMFPHGQELSPSSLIYLKGTNSKNRALIISNPEVFYGANRFYLEDPINKLYSLAEEITGLNLREVERFTPEIISEEMAI